MALGILWLNTNTRTRTHSRTTYTNSFSLKHRSMHSRARTRTHTQLRWSIDKQAHPSKCRLDASSQSNCPIKRRRMSRFDFTLLHQNVTTLNDEPCTSWRHMPMTDKSQFPSLYKFLSNGNGELSGTGPCQFHFKQWSRYLVPEESWEVQALLARLRIRTYHKPCTCHQAP